MIATIETSVPTQNDLVSAEELREHWCELNGRIHALMHTNSMLHQQIEEVISAFSGAVALFEENGSGRKAELRREMAAMRCQFRRAKLAAKIHDVEEQLAKVSSELAEFKVRDQLRGILDKCAD